MTSIKGYTKLLSLGTAGELSPAQQEFLKVIARNVERMDRLVSYLLELSRLDAGRIRLERRIVPVDWLIAQALQALADQIASRDLTLTKDIPAFVPLVHVDVARLNQVLTDLLSNACHFTPKGGLITLRVRFPAQYLASELVDSAGVGGMEAKRYVQIEVSDSGIGIPEDDKPRVFTPFFRGDHPLVREAAGAGLGLAVSKRLIELHGGRMWFTSQLEQGSTFALTVPVAPTELEIP